MKYLHQDPKYADFIEWLNENVTAQCRELLDPAQGTRQIADDALAAWLDDIDEDGHIEIPAVKSANGNPVNGRFPELANKF